MRSRRGVRTAALLVILFVAACDGGTNDAEPRKQKTSAAVATLIDGPETPPIPFITNRAIVGMPDGRSRTLRGVAIPALMGWQSPVGVPSPGWDGVVYSAWVEYVDIDPAKSNSEQGIEQGQAVARPQLRMIDLHTDKDHIFEEGAFSFAWRDDGAVAYFKGVRADYLVDRPYPGTVMVRKELDGRPVPWTVTPGAYIVLGWARDALLVYVDRFGEGVDLVVFDGPGRRRVLAQDSELVAVSPDGTRVIVASSGSPSVVRVIDVASGATQAELDLAKASNPRTGKPLESLSYGGSWVLDRVAASSGGGIALLRVAANKISVFDKISFDREAFPMPVHEPQLSADARRVRAWAPIRRDGGRYVFLDCEIETHECVSGAPRRDRNFHPVYSLSRPSPETTGQ